MCLNDRLLCDVGGGKSTPAELAEGAYDRMTQGVDRIRPNPAGVAEARKWGKTSQRQRTQNDWNRGGDIHSSKRYEVHGRCGMRTQNQA